MCRLFARRLDSSGLESSSSRCYSFDPVLFWGDKRRKKYKDKNGTLRAQDARPFASSLVEAQFISFQFREGKKMRPREKKTMTIL